MGEVGGQEDLDQLARDIEATNAEENEREGKKKNRKRRRRQKTKEKETMLKEDLRWLENALKRMENSLLGSKLTDLEDLRWLENTLKRMENSLLRSKLVDLEKEIEKEGSCALLTLLDQFKELQDRKLVIETKLLQLFEGQHVQHQSADEEDSKTKEEKKAKEQKEGQDTEKRRDKDHEKENQPRDMKSDQPCNRCEEKKKENRDKTQMCDKQTLTQDQKKNDHQELKEQDVINVTVEEKEAEDMTERIDKDKSLVKDDIDDIVECQTKNNYEEVLKEAERVIAIATDLNLGVGSRRQGGGAIVTGTVREHKVGTNDVTNEEQSQSSNKELVSPDNGEEQRSLKDLETEDQNKKDIMEETKVGEGRYEWEGMSKDDYEVQTSVKKTNMVDSEKRKRRRKKVIFCWLCSAAKTDEGFDLHCCAGCRKAR